MEIGEKNVNRLEAIAGRDEQSGLAAKGLDDAVIAGSGFQGACRRRSDSNDASARAAGRVERLRGRWRKLGPFGVHAVIRGVVGGHRQERPSPDMERDAFPVDAVLLQTSEQTWR